MVSKPCLHKYKFKTSYSCIHRPCLCTAVGIHGSVGLQRRPDCHRSGIAVLLLLSKVNAASRGGSVLISIRAIRVEVI